VKFDTIWTLTFTVNFTIWVSQFWQTSFWLDLTVNISEWVSRSQQFNVAKCSWIIAFTWFAWWFVPVAEAAKFAMCNNTWLFTDDLMDVSGSFQNRYCWRHQFSTLMEVFFINIPHLNWLQSRTNNLEQLKRRVNVKSLAHTLVSSSFHCCTDAVGSAFVSEMTYNVSSGTLNSTTLYTLPWELSK